MTSDSNTNNIPKPNRVIHISHFIPTICSLSADGKNWDFSVRRGHSAMYAGIQSLSPSYDNIHIGYIGELKDQNNHTIPYSQIDESMKESVKTALLNDKNKQIPVFIDPVEASRHYEGYCKSELWPMFHYLLEDLKVDMKTQEQNWNAYVSVNQAYADVLIEIYQKNDFVWIHDYHLMLVPEMIRKAVPHAKIGFFLHAPFPSSEIFRCLPKRKEILNGLLSANQIGFQTYAYARHFMSTCCRVLGLEQNAEGIDVHGSTVYVNTFPIGVAVELSDQYIKSEGYKAKLQALRQQYAGKKVIFGRDKLEHATGVLQKFHTIEKFFTKYPEWKDKVVLVQVTSSPSAHFTSLENKIAELVAKINSTYGSLEFSPINLFQHSIDRDEYYALLTIADVALVTSVRDGMNTTSHEYVYCQTETHGSLILSEFTGTAGALKEAILVNPFDFEGVADSINRALTMSKEEKKEIHSQLYEYVTKHDCKFWANSFLKTMAEHCAISEGSIPTPYLKSELMKSAYQSSKKRLLLFDYDGTLTEIRNIPAQATPSQRMLDGMKKLTENPNNKVWIISGRDQKFLTEWVGDVPNLGLSAEHGCFMRHPNSPPDEWINLAEESNLDWKKDVVNVFTYFTERTPGSFIEHKRASLTWHYRMSDPDYGSFQAKECQTHLENAVVSKLPVEILIGKKNIEVRPLFINKGEIVKKLLEENPDCDFVYCAGDDKTDEDMFRAIKPLSSDKLQEDHKFTVTIGSANKKTSAKWHVNSPQDIIDSLHLLGDI